MTYITQLIYLNPEKEKDFNNFESAASQIIRKHNGNVMFRYKPTSENLLESTIDTPAEIQMVTFPSESELKDYMNDKERDNILFLKQQSVAKNLIVKGTKM